MNAAVVGIGDAVVQTPLFGVGAAFPPKYTSAIMTGNGFAGIVFGFFIWGFCFIVMLVICIND